VGTMGPWVVCDEQLMYAECLAAALRRRGARDVRTMVCLPTKALTGTLVLSVRARAGDEVAGVRATHPDVRLVCLTSGEPEAAQRALAAGADEVLGRDAGLDEVLRALDADQTVPPSVPRQIQPRPAVPFADAHLRFLTFRERETLDLLVAAKSTETIAHEMHITTATARGYVQSILEKLCVHSRLEAVAYAARHASVPLDEAWCSW
jgi:two-component system nitrate/nitrite response regulator NarL